MAAAAIGFYGRQIAPRLLHGGCSLRPITQQRRRLVPQASGVVVEIGIGSGLNLPHYDPARVSRVIGVDPDPVVLRMGRERAEAAPFEVDILPVSAEEIPLETGTADTVLATYTFCSLRNVEGVLTELKRVLKPGGQLLFCEHGRSHHPRTAKWQDRIAPMWSLFTGGCSLNRNVSRLIANSGFRVVSVDNYVLPLTPEILGFHYLGMAVPR